MKKQLVLMILSKVIPEMSEAGKELMAEALAGAWIAARETPKAWDNIAVALAMDLFDCPPEGMTEAELWTKVQEACNATESKVDNVVFRLAKALAGN